MTYKYEYRVWEGSPGHFYWEARISGRGVEFARGVAGNESQAADQAICAVTAQKNKDNAQWRAG